MNAQSLRFLKAMDVDVWVRRDLPPPLSTTPATSVSTQDSAAPLLSAAPHDVAQGVIARDAVITKPHPAETWDELADAVRGCTLCRLCETRTQTVFGVGNLKAQWLVIGEAPGADEDRLGEPFVGRAGQLLNSMLRAVGLAREQVFIANVLKCRPPGNRDPKPDEVVSCAPYLAQQIAWVNPRLILCVGRIAAQNLLQTEVPIGKLRGKVHYLGAERRPVVVTYHPAYLLRSPGEKRKAWEDLKLAVQTHAPGT